MKLAILLKAYISRLRDESSRLSQTCVETRAAAAVKRSIADDLQRILDARKKK